MSTKAPGYVYILTNPSFREDWMKIGKSSRLVDVRNKELDIIAEPLPFEIFKTMKTAKSNDVEKLVYININRLAVFTFTKVINPSMWLLKWLLKSSVILSQRLMIWGNTIPN